MTGFFIEREGGTETIWLEKSATRMIHGTASTLTPNSHNYSLDPEGCRLTLPLPLLFGHGFIDINGNKRTKGYKNLEEAAIGEVVYLKKSQRGIYFRAILFETKAADHAWNLIVSGEANAISAGPDPKEEIKMSGIVDGVKYYSGWTMHEVSVCRQGANPDARCEVFLGRHPPEKASHQEQFPRPKGAVKLISPLTICKPKRPPIKLNNG